MALFPAQMYFQLELSPGTEKSSRSQSEHAVSYGDGKERW